LTVIPTELKKEIDKNAEEKYVVVLVNPGSYRQEQFTQNDATSTFPYGMHPIVAQCSMVSKYKTKEFLH